MKLLKPMNIQIRKKPKLLLNRTSKGMFLPQHFLSLPGQGLLNCKPLKPMKRMSIIGPQKYNSLFLPCQGTRLAPIIKIAS